MTRDLARLALGIDVAILLLGLLFPIGHLLLATSGLGGLCLAHWLGRQR